MERSNFYQKNASHIELSEGKHPQLEPKNEEYSSKVNPNYSKGKGFETPYVFLIIFSGGTVTERNYFSPILNNPKQFPTLILRFETDDIILKGNEPRIFSAAYAMQNEYAKSEVKGNPDKYFILTDVDTFMPAIRKHKPLCKARGITLIVSNPCFEVWNYYSKYTDKFTNFTPPAESAKLSHELKIFVHTRTKPQIKEKTVLYDLATNISTSIANYKENTDGLPDLYSTNMHLLGSDLLSHVNHILHTPQHLSPT